MIFICPARQQHCTMRTFQLHKPLLGGKHPERRLARDSHADRPGDAGLLMRNLEIPRWGLSKQKQKTKQHAHKNKHRSMEEHKTTGQPPESTWRLRFVNCSNNCLNEHPVANTVNDLANEAHTKLQHCVGGRGLRQVAGYTEPDWRGQRKIMNTSLNQWNQNNNHWQCLLREKIQESNRCLAYWHALHTMMQLNWEPRHFLGPVRPAASEGQTTCNPHDNSWNETNASVNKQQHVVNSL